MACVPAAAPPLRPRPAPRLPLDPDGRPTLPSQGPRSAGTVAECFGLALADDDAMLVVRSRLRADGPGLPRLPQRMRHRDAFGALTASARRCAPRSGEPASIPKQSSTLARRPPEPSGRRRRRSLRSRKQGPTRSRFPLLAWPCGSMPSAPRPTARSSPTRSSSPAN